MKHGWNTDRKMQIEQHSCILSLICVSSVFHPWLPLRFFDPSQEAPFPTFPCLTEP
jgi:hypothetical protein